MDDSLYFTEQHLAVRNMVREFARSEVAPVAAELDAKAEFPWANIKKMGELGLLGIPWPEELGGAGLDLLSYMIVINEMAKVDASHAITISAHTTLGTSPIVNFGTAAQRRKYVPLLASGKVLGGFGLTEPSAGSDAASTRSTAVRKGSHYVLNGTKAFITHGGVGEVFVVTAVTEPGKGTKGISSFIVTKQASDLEKSGGIGHDDSLPAMPGFRSGKKEDKLGWRASDTRSLVFEDVEVPAENLLGEEGEGFNNFMRTLDSGRVGMAALSRDRGRRVRARAAVRDPAEAVRTTHRQLPGNPVSAGGHGDRDRSSEALDVSRSMAGAAQAAIHQAGRNSQAVLLRAGDAHDDQGDSDSRRVWLH